MWVATMDWFDLPRFHRVIPGFMCQELSVDCGGKPTSHGCFVDG